MFLNALKTLTFKSSSACKEYSSAGADKNKLPIITAGAD